MSTAGRNPQNHAHVVVAVSAFKSDQPVIELVRRIVREEWPVQEIVVVDSLGSGEVEQFVSNAGLGERVRYHSSAFNLGSAGNLRKRLELGVALGAEFVLALNHDAVVDRATVEALLSYTHLDRIGALYPLRFRKGKGIYDLTGTSDFSFRARGSVSAPGGDLIEVHWSSSNGALYATAPLRHKAIGPDPSLWMGWEDYLYGLQLRSHGYRQFIVTSAETVDDYEYRSVSVAGRRVALADKPSWYLYYSTRNMILANVHDGLHPLRALKTMLWVLMMAAHVWKHKESEPLGSALRCYTRGVLDGLRNQRGKWTYP